jgi:hypothetical protein
METRNAVITSVGIEIEDHGYLSAYVTLDYGSSAQVFGNYGLYTTKNGVDGKNYAGHFIYRVLEVAGVYKWEQLKGKAVRVIADHSHVEAVGNIVSDTWFNPAKEFADEHQDVSA